MNSLLKLVQKLALIAACLLIVPAVLAGDWNDGRGLGNPYDDPHFSGSGETLGAIGSVQSNSLYYVTSAKASGAPSIDRVLCKSDLTGFNLDYLVATNTWLIASNGARGTNIVWLTSTNSGLATNDILVYHSVQQDSYQLVVLSGNATDSGGLVYTNAQGYNAVKLWNNLTNSPYAGDRLFKMARIQRFNPLSDHTITNKLLSPWGNWLNLGDLVAGQSVGLRGRKGLPAAIVQTYSNSAGLFVSGQYSGQLPRR